MENRGACVVCVCACVGLKTVHGLSSPGRGIQVPTETNSTILHRAAASYLCPFAGLPRLEEHAGSARKLCHGEAAGGALAGFLAAVAVAPKVPRDSGCERMKSSDSLPQRGTPGVVAS